MKAIGIKQSGGPEQLQVIDRQTPTLQEGEVLIKVEAAGINRTDILSRERQTAQPENVCLGVEVAGVVADANNSHLKIGDRVMGLVNEGGVFSLNSPVSSAA